MDKKISIITGHYGSGKTNIAVNLVRDMAKQGKKVTIVDLDIVNPYFRTADFKKELEKSGVRVIAPVYANTNLDSPVLPAEINSVFDNPNGYAVIDVGGDDAGAIALGQYARRIAESDYDMYYVINEKRYLTKNSKEAASLLKDIEAVSRIKATKIINNTNLGKETTLQIVEHSKPFADEVSELTGLPLALTCIDKSIDPKNGKYYGVDILVKTFWSES